MCERFQIDHLVRKHLHRHVEVMQMKPHEARKLAMYVAYDELGGCLVHVMLAAKEVSVEQG